MGWALAGHLIQDTSIQYSLLLLFLYWKVEDTGQCRGVTREIRRLAGLEWSACVGEAETASIRPGKKQKVAGTQRKKVLGQTANMASAAASPSLPDAL